MKAASKFSCLLGAAILLAASMPANAVLIAAQNFNDNTALSAALNVNDFANRAAANAAIGTTALGTFADGTGLGWRLSGAPFIAGDQVDLIGVVDTSVLQSALQNIDFNNNSVAPSPVLYIDDPDGTITLAFDAVDTSEFMNLSLSFELAVNSNFLATDIYEAGEGLVVSVNGIDLLSLLGSQLNTVAFDTETLQPLVINLSVFDGQSLNIAVRLTSDMGNEDFALDNFELTGTRVAQLFTPSTVALLGIGLLGVGLARRRSR